MLLIVIRALDKYTARCRGIQRASVEVVKGQKKVREGKSRLQLDGGVMAHINCTESIGDSRLQGTIRTSSALNQGLDADDWETDRSSEGRLFPSSSDIISTVVSWPNPCPAVFTANVLEPPRSLLPYTSRLSRTLPPVVRKVEVIGIGPRFWREKNDRVVSPMEKVLTVSSSSVLMRKNQAMMTLRLATMRETLHCIVAIEFATPKMY